MTDKHFTVMVVDDAEENLRLLQIMLEDDYQLALCRSGTECLSSIVELAPDLVLLDVHMPGTDGYEVCRQLKQNPETRDIPVMFVSAMTSVEERLAGYEAGGEEYVTKPFDVEELLRKIAAALAERDAELKLEARALEAQAVAQDALISSSELGVVNHYSRMSSQAGSYSALAKSLFDATRNLGLNCSLGFRTDSGPMFFGCSESSLEASLLEKFIGGIKIVDFNARTLVNTPNCSILIKNMPLSDPTRYGRLKDHLATIADVTEGRFESLQLVQNAAEQRAAAIRTLIDSNDSQLEYILTELAERDAQRKQIMMNMLVNVEDQLFSMGLDDDQEKHLVKMLDDSVQQVDALPSIGREVAASFEEAKQKLGRLLNEQPT